MPSQEVVLENVQFFIFYYQIHRLKGFLLESLIGRIPSGSKIYIFVAYLRAIISL